MCEVGEVELLALRRRDVEGGLRFISRILETFGTSEQSASAPYG